MPRSTRRRQPRRRPPPRPTYSGAPVDETPAQGTRSTSGRASGPAQYIARQTPYLVGEMENELVVAQMALREMVATANDYDFEPINDNANAVLIRKTIATKAAIRAVDKAMEAVGGSSIFRSRGLEMRFRDVRAGAFHPLPEKSQTLFTGRMGMGLDPV